jgi:uncharacterized protein YndB with AHSA1/START domain
LKSTEPPVSISQHYGCPASRLWTAITDSEQMRQWYFDNIPDFQPRKGFRTSFTVDSGERQFLHLWEVTAVEPGRKIAYSWVYGGYPGKAEAVFHIEEQQEGSRLNFNFTVQEDFPDTVPEFTRESCLGGWHYFLVENLKLYLANR